MDNKSGGDMRWRVGLAATLLTLPDELG